MTKVYILLRDNVLDYIPRTYISSVWLDEESAKEQLIYLEKIGSDFDCDYFYIEEVEISK